MDTEHEQEANGAMERSPTLVNPSPEPSQLIKEVEYIMDTDHDYLITIIIRIPRTCLWLREWKKLLTLLPPIINVIHLLLVTS